MRTKYRVVWWVACLSLTFAGCSTADDATRSDEDRAESRCRALADHLVDLRLDGLDGVNADHRRALRDSLGADFVTRCVNETPSEQVECAIASSDTDGAAECLAHGDASRP